MASWLHSEGFGFQLHTERVTQFRSQKDRRHQLEGGKTGNQIITWNRVTAMEQIMSKSIVVNHAAELSCPWESMVIMGALLVVLVHCA